MLSRIQQLSGFRRLHIKSIHNALLFYRYQRESKGTSCRKLFHDFVRFRNLSNSTTMLHCTEVNINMETQPIDY